MSERPLNSMALIAAVHAMQSPMNFFYGTPELRRKVLRNTEPPAPSIKTLTKRAAMKRQGKARAATKSKRSRKPRALSPGTPSHDR